MNPDFMLEKQIDAFRNQAKRTGKPIQLTGLSNYAARKESILSRVELVKCHFILDWHETQAPEGSTSDDKLFWDYQN
jgi:hypothetical protein